MISARLRADVKQAIEGTPCPLCGHARPPVPIRQIARESGVPASTLHRFVKAGGNTSAQVIDALDAWVIQYKAML